MRKKRKKQRGFFGLMAGGGAATGAGMGELGGMVSNAMGSVANTLGTMYQQNAGLWATKETNEANRALVRENRQYAEAQQNTAWQRGVVDMKAAGINPMLAVSQGGAGSAQVAPAQDQANTVNAGGAAKAGLSSAMDAKRFALEMEAQNASVQMAKATTASKVTEAELNLTSAKNVEEGTKQKTLENQVIKKKMPQIEAETKLGKTQADTDASMNKYDNIVKRVGSGLGIIQGIMNPVKSLGQMLRGGTTDAKPNSSREADIYRSGVSRGRSEYRGK